MVRPHYGWPHLRGFRACLVENINYWLNRPCLKKPLDLKQVKPCVERKLSELQVTSKALCVEFDSVSSGRNGSGQLIAESLGIVERWKQPKVNFLK